MLDIRLDFNNPRPGFYGEGGYDASMPRAGGVFFISGKYDDGYQPEARVKIKCLLGEKYSQTFLISQGEARDFREIHSASLDNLLRQLNIPDEFVKWFEMKRNILSSK